MNSPVEICNLALSHLGVERIASFSEQTKAARLCSAQYDQTRKALLEAHNWNFAIKRQELAPLPTAPLFDWQFQFPLPVDCIRVMRISSEESFVTEGRVLLTDSSTASIKYITDITNVTLFTALFNKVLSYKIAEDLAFNLTNSMAVKEEVRDVATELMKDARGYDSKEGTMEPFMSDVWLDSRHNQKSARGRNTLV